MPIFILEFPPYAGADINLEDTEGRKYTEFACLHESQEILVWLAAKYPGLYINDETKVRFPAPIQLSSCTCR
jgi:hypothetical protein